MMNYSYPIGWGIGHFPPFAMFPLSSACQQSLTVQGLVHWNWWCACWWRVRKFDHHWFSPCSTTWSRNCAMPRTQTWSHKQLGVSSDSPHTLRIIRRGNENKQKDNKHLVGGLKHLDYFPFHIWDNWITLPIDELIFFKMVETTNQTCFPYFCQDPERKDFIEGTPPNGPMVGVFFGPILTTNNHR